MQQQRSAFLRKRKLLIAIPALVLPFVTLMFWSLGGGKKSAAPSTNHSVAGLNMDLPSAQLKNDKEMNKMSYYEQAASDSSRLRKQLKEDPYRSDDLSFDASVTENSATILPDDVRDPSNPLLPTQKSSSAEAEATVYQKIKQLNEAIEQPSAPARQYSNNYRGVSSVAADVQVEKLEQLMEAMSKKEVNAEDPELAQLNGMLDKIAAIQQPEKAIEKKNDAAVSAEKTTLLQTTAPSIPISLLDTNKFGSPIIGGQGFYGVSTAYQRIDTGNAINAVIQENQVLVNGATVKLRLVQPLYIQGSRIPSGSFLYGIATLQNERLTIAITSLQHQRSVYPVRLSVYDLDGLEGIYIPGTITRDALKQSANNSISTLGLPMLDPSIATQAASAGIETAKNLLSRKVKLIKVQVKAGYQVLLKQI